MPTPDIKRNISALVVADVIGKLLPFITFPYLTRVLGPELYGKYGFAANAVAFLALLASPGFVPYGIRAAAQRPGEERSIGGTINGIRLVFTLGALLLLVLYTFTLAPRDGTIRTLILLSGLALIPSALNLDWLLTGKSMIPPVAAAGITGQAAYTALVLLFVRRPSDIWVIPLAGLGGALLNNTILQRVARIRFGPIFPRFHKADFRAVVPTSLLLGFASLMSMIYDKVDTILLGYLRPKAEVGVYVANYRLMGMVMSFIPILGRVFFPLVAQSVDTEGGDKHSRLFFQMLFFAAVPLILGGIILAAPLTRFVIGPEYSGSGLLLSLLLPNVLAGGLASYYAGIKLLAINRNREYVISVSVGGISNIVFNLIFIPRWGAPAAAVTTCASQLAVAGLAAWYGRDHRTPSLLRSMRLPLLGSLAMTGVLVAMMNALPGTHVLVLISVGVIVYLSFVLGFRARFSQGMGS